MMDRRSLLHALSGLTIAPTIAAGQPAAARGAIGYLHPNTLAAATYTYMAPVWRAQGFVEGQSVHVRSAEGDLSRIPRLLDELVALGSGVLILVGPQTLRIAFKHALAVPIVAIDLESDPVKEGYAQSVGRPGGNITGLFMDFPDLAAKWLQLLKECAPAVDRIAIIWDPTSGRGQVDAITAAASQVGIGWSILQASTPAQGGNALRQLQPPPSTGVVTLGTPARAVSDEPITKALVDLRLPSIFHLKRYVVAGGLMSYGVKLESYFPRAVELAMKILAGARPGELPIERPERFDFVINLKTATALGLTVPPTLLVRADEVIE
jgi:putative ABC transport system substrate-binding protein